MTHFAKVALLGSSVLLGGLPLCGGRQAAQQTQQKSAGSTQVAGLARGKKLILKDGGFQLVRSYERSGDRVRYFSAERGDWEEIPAAMVDWEATAKAEADEEKAEAELTAKVHKQEVETKAAIAMDIDASLQVAPGVFLPPGEGMFVIEGKSVTALEQAGSQVKLDKKRLIQQALSPIQWSAGVLSPGSAPRPRPHDAHPEKQPARGIGTGGGTGASDGKG
jgi:predicted  nucleic acid-binding Zn-ribbon protein